MTDSARDHLLELAHGYVERSLGPAEVAQLETLLAASPESRLVYLDYLHDHASLHWEQIGQEGEEVQESDEGTLDDPIPFRQRRLPTAPQAFAAAAVVSLLALVLMRSTPPAATTTFATMEKTESARWESAALPTAEGARLGAGELHLVRGLATIAFDSGAEVVLEAPARLTLVDAMNCVLASGTVVAEVADSAKGFTIRTPRANVIDHGTRFAVNVHPTSGATQTQVFDGLVEVELPSTRESIELRKGQQNLVAGEQIGQVHEGSEEGTWSEPETPPSRREPGLVTLTTADPGGADGYVWGGEPTKHVSDTLLLLKNGLEPRAPHRKSYLRFDLASLAPGTVASARLDLRFAPTGWGLASHLGDAEFSVYGIADDTLDQWDAAALDWSNAPANDPESGHRLDSKKVVKLGSFTVPRGIQSGTFGIRGEALAAFLNGDANRLATLVVVRETRETRGGGLVHAFASSRHATLPPPTLELRLKP